MRDREELQRPYLGEMELELRYVSGKARLDGKRAVKVGLLQSQLLLEMDTDLRRWIGWD
jgi:hypothetical protein